MEDQNFTRRDIMKINRKWQGILVAGLLAMMISPALAQENQQTWSQDLPEVMHQGAITYTSGGFGLEERDALKATAKDYNILISNADREGKFTADTSLVITNKGSRETLTVTDAGPLFYARVPAGTYVVKAANGSQKAERTVSVTGQKQERVYFIWSE
jgi:hypothetical protein